MNNQVSRFRDTGLPVNRSQDTRPFPFDSKTNSDSAGKLNESFRTVFWPRKGLILMCGLACAAVAFLTSLLQPPLYRAKSSLEIEDLNNNFLQLGDIDPVSRSANMADSSYLQTQIDELTSNALLARVAARLHIEEKYRPATKPKLSFFDQLRERIGLHPPAPQTPAEMAISEIRSNLNVSVSRGASRIVSIEYTSGDPKAAADFANTLANEFIEHGVDLRMGSVQHLRDWLTSELDRLRTKLQTSEDELQSYSQSAGLLFTDEKNSVAEAKLKQLQAELTQAQADRMLKQSKYELVNKATPEGLAQLTENGPIRDYELKLADARQQLAQAQSLYTPNHYKVKQLKAQISELESSLASQRKEIVNLVDGDYNAAIRRETLLSEAYSQQAALVSAQDIKASRYNLLKGEVDTNRQLYDAMLQKLKNVNMAAAMRAGAAAVVDPAEPPTQPFEPQPASTSLIGLVSGLLLGSIYVFLRDRWANRFKAPGELESILHVPELGAIPSIPSVDTFRRKSLAPPADKSSAKDHAHTPPRGQLQVAADDLGRSHIVHSFRAILASLVFSGEGQLKSSVLVVTSPSPREGKTTTASNLAVTLASVGKQVLLVDADLINPKLHQIFSTPNEVGLSDLILERSISGTIQLSAYVKKLDVPGLSILTSGSVRMQAANHLYSSQVADLFDRLRQHYDFVVIDCPPVLPVADARLLSWHADGVVLVVRASSTDRESAKIAADRLLADGARIIGTVLNDFDPGAAGKYNPYCYTYAPHTSSKGSPRLTRPRT
jgi:polysaccharide biosynthesis transport protein